MPTATRSAPGAAGRSSSRRPGGAGTTAHGPTGSTRTGSGGRRRSGWWRTRVAGRMSAHFRQQAKPSRLSFRLLSKLRCRSSRGKCVSRWLGHRRSRLCGTTRGSRMAGPATAVPQEPPGSCPTAPGHIAAAGAPHRPETGGAVASRVRIRDGGGTAACPAPGLPDGRSAPATPPLPLLAVFAPVPPARSRARSGLRRITGPRRPCRARWRPLSAFSVSRSAGSADGPSGGRTEPRARESPAGSFRRGLVVPGVRRRCGGPSSGQRGRRTRPPRRAPPRRRRRCCGTAGRGRPG